MLCFDPRMNFAVLCVLLILKLYQISLAKTPLKTRQRLSSRCGLINVLVCPWFNFNCCLFIYLFADNILSTEKHLSEGNFAGAACPDIHIIFICSKLLPPINISTNIIHKKIHGNLRCNFYAWLTICIQCSRKDVKWEIKFKIQYILLDKNHWTMDWGYLCYHDCPELCFPING